MDTRASFKNHDREEKETVDLGPAIPEGDDERSKDTQSISMQFGQQDLVEGERMSGQDVRTNNGAASPGGLRSETKTRPENHLRGGFWRTAPPDRPIAASTAARARLQQHERGAGHVFSVRTPRARPNEPAPPPNAHR